MQLKNKGKYILLLNIHGLIRGKELELGRDADTGGQTKYVLDLARALGEHKEVDQVDLITREVKDKNCSADYAKHEEVISDNVRIVRIKAGPDEYIRKELLWDYLDNFMDNLTNWLKIRKDCLILYIVIMQMGDM